MSQLKGLSHSLRGIVASGLAEPEPEFEDKPADIAPARVHRVTPVVSKPLPKSKDPEWKGYSLFLKKDTHAEMNFLLRRQDKGEDMSDLVQRLVEQWVSKNRPA